MTRQTSKSDTKKASTSQDRSTAHDTAPVDTVLNLQRSPGNRTTPNMLNRITEFSPDTALDLQRTIGNRATTNLFTRQNHALPLQRRVNKLPNEATLKQDGGGGGFNWGKATGYDKILSAVGAYYKIGTNDFLSQIQQLVVAYDLLRDWEVSHGMADTSLKSKDNKEKNRRGLLANMRQDYLPEEMAGVFDQAQQSNVDLDAPILQSMMNVMDGNPGLRGPIEQEYGRKLRSFSATNAEINPYTQLLTSGKSQVKGYQGDTGQDYMDKYQKQKDDAADTSDIDDRIRMIDPSMPLYQKMLAEKQKQQAFSNLLNQMSAAEYVALKNYTGTGYQDYNPEMRRQNTGLTGDKKNRGKQQASREETQMAVLLASSAMNKFPDWDGSTLWRGEDIGGRESQFQVDSVIVFQSFTSTTFDKNVADGFSSGTSSAVFEITGITSSGKNITSIADVKTTPDGFGNQKGGESEVLLKPYTKIKIDKVTKNGNSYKIEAHEV